MNKTSLQFKKVLASSLMALTLSVGLSSCTDREVGIVAGAIAIGAGAAIIADSTRRDSPRSGGYYQCRGGYVHRTHSYRDYWGNWRTETRTVWDSCATRRWVRYSAYDLMSEENVDPIELTLGKVSVAEWAEEFALGLSATEKLARALEQARNSNPQELLDLGLSSSDLLRISKFEKISEASIDQIAMNLDAEKSSIADMLNRLLEKAQDQVEEDCRTRRVHKGRRVEICKLVPIAN